ncbi:MAG: PD40 domain-containing protein [Anaerolineae bacterium]|nr:PD40 domain-containing protein [Anaerolineae bacterium]
MSNWRLSSLVALLLSLVSLNLVTHPHAQNQSTLEAETLWQFGQGTIYDFDWVGQNLILATNTGLWLTDATFKQPLIRLDQGIAVAQGVRSNQDGTRIATLNGDAIFRVIDVKTGEVKVSSPYIGALVMAWQPKGDVLALSDLEGKQNRVILWDSHSGKQTEVVGTYSANVVTLSWNPDGNLLAIGLANGEIVIQDMTTHKPIKEFTADTANIHAVVWSHDGHKLAVTLLGDVPLNIWQTDTFERVKGSFDAHFAREIAWNDDSNQIAGALVDGSIKIWNIATDQITILYSANNAPYFDLIEHLAWHGDQLAILDREHHLEVWNIVQYSVVGESKAFTEYLKAMAVSPDGKLIALYYKNSYDVLVVDTVTGNLEKTLNLPRPLEGSQLGWSPSGEQLAFSGSTLVIWQIQKDADQVPIEVEDVDRFSWSPDGKLAVMSRYTGLDKVPVRFVDAKTGEVSTTTHDVEGLIDVLWSPDGKRIAFYKYNRPSEDVEVTRAQIDVWDVQKDVTITVKLPYMGSFRLEPDETFRWLADSSGLIGFTGAGMLWRWHLNDAEADAVAASGPIEPINPAPLIWFDINRGGNLLAVSNPTVDHTTIMDAASGQALLNMDEFATLPYLLEWGKDNQLFLYDGAVHSYQIKNS